MPDLLAENMVKPRAQKPERVLIVYSARPPIIADLTTAFARLGIDVRGVYADENHWFDKYIIRRVNKWAHNLRIIPKSKNYFSNHPLAHLNFRSQRLREAVAEYHPDLILLVRGINFRHDVLAELPMIFGWWIEREERVAEALREAGLFDWYFYISRSCVEKSAEAGFTNCSYRSHLVNPARFFRTHDNGEKKYDVCFVGNWSPRRQEYLEAVLEITPNVAIYGAKWLKKNFFNPKFRRAILGREIYDEDLNQLYNASRVILNVNNWGVGEGKARSGMNMRIFEVPSSGAFLLTDGSRELEEFLVPGEHLAVFEGIEDMKRSIRHYLAHPESRQSIADAGHAHVTKNYSYDVFAEEIVRQYKASANLTTTAP